MTRKKLFGLLIACFVLLAVVTFFVVSVCLAQQHGHSLVNEWQSWFGLLKESADQVVETTKAVIRV